MTNADKIIALLLKTPGLDDDEISSHTNVRPRQQVYQICTRLESKGQIKRLKGPRGKIVNYLTSTIKGSLEKAQKPSQSKRPSISTSTQSITRKLPVDHKALDTINSLNMRKTLILIPCSGKKTEIVRGRLKGPSILDILPTTLGEELRLARSQMAEKSQLD